MNNQSRQSFLGEDHEAILDSSNIGIIGLCGGGSHVAQQLAHIGIGNFTIADFDDVEDTNLTRMAGSKREPSDVGRLKTDVIADLIRGIRPGASITQINGRWLDGVDAFQKCGIIVGCVDKYTERDNIERFCRYHSIVYVDIGMGVHKEVTGYSISGQVIISEAGGPCMRCLGLLTDEKLTQEEGLYGEAGSVPQVIWPNGVLASIAVGHVISTLLPWSANLERFAMVEYDGNRQIVSKSNRLPYLTPGSCKHYPSD